MGHEWRVGGIILTPHCAILYSDSMDTFSDLLTVKEVAQKLRYHPEHVRKLAREGKLPGAKKLLGRWLFDKAMLSQWVAHGRRTLTD